MPIRKCCEPATSPEWESRKAIIVWQPATAVRHGPVARLPAHDARQQQDGLVTRSLAADLLHSDLEVDCPTCQYPIWVTWAEIIAQAAVLCPCCRTRVWFRDAAGSAQNAVHVTGRIDQTLEGFGQ